MTLIRLSGCKINLLLNILGKRADGFHELETVMQPVALHDELAFSRGGSGIRLTCSNPALPVDSTNLVHRAAAAFLETARITEGVGIHLTKNIPMAAGLGGGSGNAATTLLGLNELFSHLLAPGQLLPIAARLGSDVPFFLQHQPALGIGRGEQVEPLTPFSALNGAWMLLIHPGFGISTPWAYRELANFPDALHGRPGRAQELIALLQADDLAAAGAAFYNSLEVPALHKHPILALYQDFLRAHGAEAALMSGSGSTTFAIVRGQAAAETLREQFMAKFGPANWTALVPL
jgi:4-diphosphocytidyl-2-C-methyl-D-erythritol kinase